MKKKTKRGSLKRHNTKLESHEDDTIDFLVQKGHRIETIEPSNKPGQHRPDILMDGVIWEMKASFGKSARTLGEKMRTGSNQSENLIIDLRKTKVNEKEAIKIINDRFRKSSKIRKVLIIKKDSSVLDYKK